MRDDLTVMSEVTLYTITEDKGKKEGKESNKSSIMGKYRICTHQPKRRVKHNRT